MLTSIGSSETQPTAGRQAGVGIVVLSDVRFVCDALAAVFGRSGKFNILGVADEFGTAIAQCTALRPGIVLIDANLPDGFAAVGRIKEFAPQVPILVLALTEEEDKVFAWIEAGVSGYIPRSAALDELELFLESVLRGEQLSAPSVVGGLVRRLAAGSKSKHASAGVELTPREIQIVRLIGEGLSNKEIAQRLKIGVATTKTHVHNVLGKLGIVRRSQAALWLRGHVFSAPLRRA